MGTETLFCKTILPPIYKIVKLNNPLMGTETKNLGVPLQMFSSG